MRYMLVGQYYYVRPYRPYPFFFIFYFLSFTNLTFTSIFFFNQYTKSRLHEIKLGASKFLTTYPKGKGNAKEK
jgi:hypothetical protein